MTTCDFTPVFHTNSVYLSIITPHHQSCTTTMFVYSIAIIMDVLLRLLLSPQQYWIIQKLQQKANQSNADCDSSLPNISSYCICTDVKHSTNSCESSQKHQATTLFSQMIFLVNWLDFNTSNLISSIQVGFLFTSGTRKDHRNAGNCAGGCHGGSGNEPTLSNLTRPLWVEKIS